MIDIQAEKLEIERVIKRVEDSENRHDVDAMLADMIDDPLLHLCGVPPVKGQEAVRQLYHGFFETFVSTNITSQQIHVSSSGDMAWEYGAYVNEYEGPDGRTKDYRLDATRRIELPALRGGQGLCLKVVIGPATP